MRWRRGITLIELIVVVALASTIMIVIATYLRAGLKEFATDQLRADVDRSTQLAFRYMAAIMQYGTVRSAVVNPTGVSSGIAFLSPLDDKNILHYLIIDPTSGGDFNRDRAIIWQRHHIFYYDETTRSIRLADRKLLVPSEKPTQLRLLEYRPGSAPERTVARNIKQVTWRVEVDPLSSGVIPMNPVFVEMTSSMPNSKYECTLRSSIVMVNPYKGGVVR